jgi:hypothetical protein
LDRREPPLIRRFVVYYCSAVYTVLAGIDFFTIEVLSWRGLVTYYVLFFIHLESRRVSLAGITRHPDQAWMEQMARNATSETWGFLDQRWYVLHDRDTKFCSVVCSQNSIIV